MRLVTTAGSFGAPFVPRLGRGGRTIGGAFPAPVSCTPTPAFARHYQQHEARHASHRAARRRRRHHQQADLATDRSGPPRLRPRCAALRPPSSVSSRGRKHPVTNRLPYFTTDAAGLETAHVPLSGKRGIGLEAILDAPDWRWIEPIFGNHWTRTVHAKDKSGRVVSRTSKALAGAEALGVEVAKRPNLSVTLARVVEVAPYGARVCRRNNDPLDFRRENLEHLAPAELDLWVAELAARPA